MTDKEKLVMRICFVVFAVYYIVAHVALYLAR